MPRSVDIIVAVRNEEENLDAFVDTVRALDIPDEVFVSMVFVEDGSTDRTVETLEELTADSHDVRYFSLVEGYGQAPAIWFGLARSKADAVIMMDVDGQHPIELVPAMIEHWLNGAKIVQGCRRNRSRSRGIRKLGAAGFNALTRLLTGVDLNDQTVFYRLVNREYKEQMLLTPRISHFLRINLEREKPQDVKRIDFDYVERDHGASSYSVVRLARFALTGILASMPFSRFVGLSVAMLLVAAGLFFTPFPGLAVCTLLLTVLFAYRYYRVCTNNVLQLMTAKSPTGLQEAEAT